MAIRVLHLDHTRVLGGAELALARMLAAGRAWRAVLLVPPSASGDAFADVPASVPVRVAGVEQRAGVSRGGMRAALAASVRLGIQAVVTRFDTAFRSADIIDANTARSAAYGALAAWTSRRPFVVHLRDIVDRDALGGFGFAMMTRVALPRANGVIANSQATLRSATPFLRTGATTAVIPSASGLVTGAPRHPNDRLRIGMLARIDPWKGQHVLLEAFATSFQDSDAELEFAGAALFGHDAYLESLRARARELGVADRVAFLGHVADVAAKLARWDIAVQASTRPEPLGQNVLQYLAAGCAVIVADEGGPAEWVEDGVNGLLIPARDASALGDALRRLATDPALREQVATAGPQTRGLLDDHGVAAAHAGFYRRILGGS